MTNREVLFKRINNALFDMQAATSQTFEQHFLTFARLLADSSLQVLNQKLTANLDVERFLEASSRSQGSMVGSARLAWPESADEVLGLQWLLVQKFAREPGGLLNFAHTYYTVGRNFTGELHSLTRQLLIPFARDYKDYVIVMVNHPGNCGGCLVKVKQVPQPVLQVVDSNALRPLPEGCRRSTPAGVGG